MCNLQSLQVRLGHTFKDVNLLTQALTHRSKQQCENNERLEFLGDAVLSIVISTALFHHHAQAREGELSCQRAALVKGETIAKIAAELEVGECLLLGAGEAKSGGHERESILAGAFEAIVGAIYCDAGFSAAQACLLRWYGNRVKNLDALADVKDAKSTLQEWLQAHQKPLPEYDAISTGAHHEQVFTVFCRVPGFSFKTQGRSSSRRKAEQIAAKLFLEKLNDSK